MFDNKLQNSDFIRQFHDSDVSIMSEIWGSEVNEIPGFDTIALSPPRKLNTKKSGRSSGGILVAVKRSLTPYFYRGQPKAGTGYKIRFFNVSFPGPRFPL